MRGVSLRGRRLPANRSAGPARPPVVPAAVPRRSRHGHAVSGFAAAHRTVPGGPYPRTAARRSITTRHSAAHESAARGTRSASGPPDPVAPRYRIGTTTTARHRPAADDVHRQPMPPPAFRRVRRPPRPLAGQPALHMPAPRRLAVAGPAAARACLAHHVPTRLLDLVVPHKPALRVPRVRAQAPRQALSAPYQPPLPRGRGHCLAEPDPALAWLASTSPEPAAGRICVLTGNRAQPVAGHVVCSQSPVTV
jgi:hypothetical protein